MPTNVINMINISFWSSVYSSVFQVVALEQQNHHHREMRFTPVTVPGTLWVRPAIESSRKPWSLLGKLPSMVTVEC